VLLAQADEAPADTRPDRDTAWAAYEAASDTVRDKARARLDAIDAVGDLVAMGVTRTEALRAIADQNGVSEKTLWNWCDLITGIAHEDRIAYLVPRHGRTTGRTKAGLDPEFFALIKSDYLRPEQPSLTSCYDRACRIARAEGLPIAPIHQVRRAYKGAVSKPTEVFFRKGAQALRQFYPHQTRDKSAMSAMECVQGDYHKFDLFVQWPGEDLPIRPQGVFFSDVYSGKILAHRLSVTANSHTVQLTIGDMIRAWGVPKSVLLDNGREFAAKSITGGTPTRFRFKVTEDDLPGLLPTLGVKVHWATPYSGQSKPIERAFRDLCDRVSKHPAFSGAYTGNGPEAKPENYGDRAIPLADFIAVLDVELAEHNAREGRRSEVAFGTSFDAAFEASYKRTPIQRASAEQERLWLLSVEKLRAGNGNGELKLQGNRYWSEWMYRIAGQVVAARFDPDALHDPLHVYDMDGKYIGAAECLDRGGFLDVSSAREVARKRGQYVRAERDKARATRELHAAEIAARLKASQPEVTATTLPQADVVQIVPAHPKAPRPVRPPAPASASRIAAGVTRLSDRRAEVASEETDEQRFARAIELEAQQAAGEALTQAQSDWLAEYQLSAAYRGRKRTQRLFGDKGEL
jgi:hypothetical protein